MLIFALSFALMATSVMANCPGNMEIVNQKCYLFGVADSREDALKQCQDADPNNHLWLINDKREMDIVMGHFGKRLISPWAWTDGIWTEEVELFKNIWVWSSSHARMSYYPDHPEEDCGGKCVEEDCGVNSAGKCATLSMNDAGVHSYQGCDCTASGLNFICESPDEDDSFECPEDGFFASEPCCDKWYNCWAGHATPEYCDEGLVFNEELDYCDFPEHTPACETNPVC